MYCDEQTRYGHNDFGQFLDIMDHYNDVLHHVWVIEPTSQIKNVAFCEVTLHPSTPGSTR
jgi:hypothetical protein